MSDTSQPSRSNFWVFRPFGRLFAKKPLETVTATRESTAASPQQPLSSLPEARPARDQPIMIHRESTRKPAIAEIPSDISIKGKEGEARMNEWLKSHGLSYLYVNQDKDTFATIFQDSVKRPDFLILLESIGLIAVDVKHRTLYDNYFTMDLENELRRVLTFERLFRIPVWYAYLLQKDGHDYWYWISALKAVEVGQIRKNNKKNNEYLAIDLENFEIIESNNDLGKLYTQRLPSTKNLYKGLIKEAKAP